MSDVAAKNIHLRLLSQASLPVQLHILAIRNEEGVRRWMYTDHLISEAEHLAFIERLKTDDRQIVFVLQDDAGDVLGLASVNAIDRRHKKSDWAYYLTQSARGGLGSALEFSFINFIFDTLGLEKLNCEVIEGNDPVVKLHKKFLFQEEGFRRSNVQKEGQRFGVHFLGLTREDWLAGRAGLQEQYAGIFAKFAIAIEWDGAL